MKVSIIITTRNRAHFLEQTLRALRCVQIPDGLDAELLLVDNGSTDITHQVVRGARLEGVEIRYAYENRPGKCLALNRGLAETDGELILFTDDDVRPPEDWLAGMCQPLIDHGPCAVAGGVRIAPHLQRPWMTALHRSWLAASDWLDRDQPRGMIGANMGFCRDVLQRVPAFDPELGPGALGFGDEQLFASQIIEAGYRIIGNDDVAVDHHFDARRLQHAAWLEAARQRGRSQAYRGHHWEHWSSRWVRPRLLGALAQLTAWRRVHRATPSEEGCSERELKLEFNYALFRAHLRERLRPRHYTYRGLVHLAYPQTEALAA